MSVNDATVAALLVLRVKKLYTAREERLALHVASVAARLRLFLLPHHDVLLRARDLLQNTSWVEQGEEPDEGAGQSRRVHAARRLLPQLPCPFLISLSITCSIRF
ncbi:hypothetical protein ZWY2020_018206 [Hordeum vulgare]|nr:hypothetical protein ZWY2020_018206 [Hordeum vulgare]